jgi:hypothetical protein
VQLQCNKNFYNKIKGFYDDREMVKLKTYPDIKHETPEVMYEDCKDWFVRWMK